MFEDRRNVKEGSSKANTIDSKMGCGRDGYYIRRACLASLLREQSIRYRKDIHQILLSNIHKLH